MLGKLGIPSSGIPSRLALQKELAIAKDHKVPLLLDDAAGIPPADNAKLYARMGIATAAWA